MFKKFLLNNRPAPTDIDQLARRNKSGIIYFTSMITRDVIEMHAFLTDVSQTFSSTWNSEDVFGRMDPIVSFQNTKRSISIGFDLIAGDHWAAEHNHVKIDALAAFLYPSYHNPDFNPTPTNPVDYSDIAFIQAPPLIKIHWNRWIGGPVGTDTVRSGGETLEIPSGLLGYIDSLSINPVIESGYFRAVTGLRDYFKVINVSFNFNVLHQDNRGFTKNGNWRGQNTPLSTMEGVGAPQGGVNYGQDDPELGALIEELENQAILNEARRQAEAEEEAQRLLEIDFEEYDPETGQFNETESDPNDEIFDLAEAYDDYLEDPEGEAADELERQEQQRYAEEVHAELRDEFVAQYGEEEAQRQAEASRERAEAYQAPDEMTQEEQQRLAEEVHAELAGDSYEDRADRTLEEQVNDFLNSVQQPDFDEPVDPDNTEATTTPYDDSEPSEPTFGGDHLLPPEENPDYQESISEDPFDYPESSETDYQESSLEDTFGYSESSETSEPDESPTD